MDIHYVNEHRAAVGRAPLPPSLSEAEVATHLALIDKHAPYGNDPWADYGPDAGLDPDDIPLEALGGRTMRQVMRQR